MRILITTPAAPRSRSGNRRTASRIARILRDLGHRVNMRQEFDRSPCDLMIALHARRSAVSVLRFRQKHANRPLVLILTGTDLYRDLTRSLTAQRSLELATRLVVLQTDALNYVPKSFHEKTSVIFQSAKGLRRKPTPLKRVYEVCVIGHLRAVKDPFRAAMAARQLSSTSKIRIVHCGAALSPAMSRRAQAEFERNWRYQWLRDLPHAMAMRRLARSRLMVLSSVLEGGANVVSEALAVQVPILSTQISGSLGILGSDYPGYFAPGDTAALRNLLERAEEDARFYDRLRKHCRRQSKLVTPQREIEGWRKLLKQISTGIYKP